MIDEIEGRPGPLDERELIGLAGTFLDVIGAEARTALLARATLADIPRREVVIDLRRSPEMAFLLEGTMRVYMVGPIGRDLTLRYARWGTLVGTLPGAAAGSRMPVAVETVSPCTMIQFDQAFVRDLADSDLRVSRALLVEFEDRLADVYRVLSMNVFTTIRERLVTHLLETAETAPDGMLVSLGTQKEIARELGTAREVVARAVAKLESEELVARVDGGIALLDVSGLARATRGWSTILGSVVTGRSDPEFASFDQSVHPVVAVDANGVILHANGRVEATFGWEPREILGQPLSVLLPSAEKNMGGDHISARLGTVGPVPIGLGASIDGLRRDGSVFPAEITFLPVRGAEGPAMLATIIDVGYRQVLRELLRQPRREMDQVAVPAAERDRGGPPGP